MDATKGNIYAILNGNKQFLIPVYQRYYSWETLGDGTMQSPLE